MAPGLGEMFLLVRHLVRHALSEDSARTLLQAGEARYRLH